MSVLDVSAYQRFIVCIQKAYRESYGIRATCMQEKVILRERQRTDEQDIMFTEVGSSLPSVVHRRSSYCMEEGGRSVQPIWTLYLNEIIACVAVVVTEEERNENITVLLNMVSKNDLEVLPDLVQERVRD